MKKFLRTLGLLVTLLLPWTMQAQFHYSCGFENDADTAGWVMVNGSQVNKWFIGSATANSGTKSLYVSNDNGQSNAYTNSNVSFTYACREVALTAGSYVFTCDWKCQGESSYDAIRIFLAPGSPTLTAGQDPNNGTSAYFFLTGFSLPNGWFDLSSGKLNMQTNWQNLYIDFAIPTDTTYTLIIAWANDGSGGTAPCGAVDNVLLTQPTCPRPNSVAVTGVSSTTADIVWSEGGSASMWRVAYWAEGDSVVNDETAFDTIHTLTNLTPNTVYTVAVYALCDDGDTSLARTSSFRTDCVPLTTLPYTQDFENEATGSSTLGSAFVPCWTLLDNGTNYRYPYVSSITAYNHTPNGSKGLYWYCSTTSPTYGDYQCIVFPSVDSTLFPSNNLLVKFWAKSTSASYRPKFKVGVMTNPADINTFQEVAQVTVVGIDWQMFEIPLVTYNGNNGYVAIRADRPTSSWTAYVDDLSLEVAPSCLHVNDINVVAGPMAARVSWAPADVDDYFGAAVEYKDASDTTATWNSLTTTETFIGITGLTPRTLYDLRVAALCSEDSSAWEYRQFTTAGLGCAEVDTNSIRNDTVGTGTTPNNYLPSYSFYNYSYTQQIYTSGELSGGSISRISFLPTAVASQRHLEISLAHTSQSTLTEFITPTDMMVVYDGTPTLVANQWVNIDFDESFVYNGSDNLLVTVRDLTNSYTSGNTFASHTSTSGVSRYVYQDAGAYNHGSVSGGSSTNARNNIVFHGYGCIQAESCVAPLAVVDGTTISSATVSWIPGGSETAWNMLYREVGDSVWTSDGSASASPYTYNNLNSGTEYELMVQSMCGGEAGSAAVLTAVTACTPYAVPLSENFQGKPFGIFEETCWYTGTTELGTDYPYPYVIMLTGDADSNKMCLIYNGGYLVMPEFDEPLNTLQVRFTLLQGGANVPLMLGIMPSLYAPISSIMPLDTLVRSELNPDPNASEVVVTYRFDNLPATTTGHITFYDAWSENYSFVDNITVEAIPNCTGVEGVTVSNVTTSDATVSWTTTGVSASNFIIEYGPRNFALGTGTTVACNASPFTLTGLNSSSTYDVYVYAVCSSLGDTSYASNRMSFQTECAAVTLPYSMNFDNVADPGITRSPLPNCWSYQMLNSGYSSDSYLPVIYHTTTADYTSSGEYCLYLYGQTVVALPEMPTTVDSLMIMFRSYRTSTYYGLEIGAVDSITPGFEASFVPIDTVEYSGNEVNAMIFLAPYTGTGRYIAFRNFYVNSPTSGYSYHYIDDLYVDYQPSCLPVTDFHCSGNTATSVTLAWTDLAPSTEWEVTYATAPLTDPALGTSVIVNSNPCTINGLSDDTTYYFYVRNICGGGDTSMWSGVCSARPGTFDMRANQTDTIRMCGGTIYDDGGVSGQYSNSQDSYIILMPDNNSSLVSISGSYNLELNYDFLHIYDGIGTSGTELWSSAEIGTFGPIESNDASGALTLYFETDGSGLRDGFEINVSCVSNYCRTFNVRIDTTYPQSATELNVTWDNSAASYEIEYGLTGFNQGTGTMLTSTTNSIQLTGLSSLTTYDVYVRGICGANVGDTGSWRIGTLTTTLCDNATVVEPGSTANRSTDYEMPVNNFYGYTLTEIIIDSAELGGANEFSAISFFYDYSSPSTVKNDVDIYIQPTTKSTFASTSDVEALNPATAVLVYSGHLNCEYGWNLFGFDTTYSYSGNGNLMVIVDDNSNAYVGSSYVFGTRECTGDKTLVYYSDSDNPDVNAPASFTGVMDVYNYRPEMQLIACGSACPRPTITSVTNDFSSITLNWTGNGTDYEVAVKTSASGAWPTETAVTGNTYTFSGLNAATSYDIRVRQNCGTELGYSDWAQRTVVTDSLPCFAPENLSVSGVGFDNVRLTWTPGSNENQWVVRVWRSDMDIYDTVSNYPTTVSGLYAGMEYSAAVQAMCGNGAEYSDWSDTITFTTEVCQPVTGVAVNDITATTAVVTWTAPNGSTAWQVNYGDMDFTQGQGTIADATATTYTITGLESESYYDVYVRTACTAELFSDWSTKVSFHTTVGIDSPEAQHINLFPNPSTGNVTVAWAENNGIWNLEVVDLQGRTVKSQTNIATASVQLTDLAAGTYFVRIYGDNVNAVKKLIVR